MNEAGDVEGSQVKSDAEGRFSISKLSPGRYHVRIEKPGFVARRASRAVLANGGVLTVSEGDPIKDVTVQLWPAAVIRGKVLDPNGEPVTGAMVMALRPGRGRHGFGWEIGSNASTDDKGDYRLFGLAPGRYVVMATARGALSGADPTVSDAEPSKDTRTVATYFPGTADYREATPVTLKPGDEFPINITLTTARTVHVRGSVTGNTSAMTVVMLVSKEEFAVGGRAQVKDGKFDIAGVAPGSYVLQAITLSEDARNPRVSHRMVEVGPGGLDNVAIVIGGQAQVKVSVAVEGGKLDFKKINLVLLPDDAFEGAGGGFTINGGEGEGDHGRIHPDGTSTFKNMDPGRYRLMVTANGSGVEDWYTKSIRMGTQDVTDTAIDVAPDANLALQVVLSAEGATVEGVAVDDKEKPWPSATVYAVPEAERRQTPDAYGQATADQNGSFKMRGLSPGAYTLFAFEDPQRAEDVRDPEGLKTLEGAGLKLKVEERSRSTVQVKVIPANDEL